MYKFKNFNIIINIYIYVHAYVCIYTCICILASFEVSLHASSRLLLISVAFGILVSDLDVNCPPTHLCGLVH